MQRCKFQSYVYNRRLEKGHMEQSEFSLETFFDSICQSKSKIKKNKKMAES